MEFNADNESRYMNRSFSFSGLPVTQKIYIEQSFQNNEGETLVRHYSSEQIYDRSNKTNVHLQEVVFSKKSEKLPSLTSNQESSISTRLNNEFKPLIEVPRFGKNIQRFPFTFSSNNVFNYSKFCPEQEGFQKSLTYNKNQKEMFEECSPMEVDNPEDCMADVHSKIEDEINDNEHKSKISKLTKSSTKKFNVTCQTNTYMQKKINILNIRCIILLICIPITLGFLFYKIDIFSTNSNNVLQNENITNVLQDLVYGQEEAVEKIKEQFDSDNNNKVLIFAGGIGVGKTYTANIIANNFQWEQNVVKVISPQHKNTYFATKLVRNLSSHGYNLIIVDNLESNDEFVTSFVNKVLSSEKNVIVILIYTIPELLYDSSEKIDVIAKSHEISNSLSEASLQHSLIMFNKLKVDDIKKCIHYAMAKKGLIIDKYDMEKILENINYEYSGCKGVYSKVALLK